MPVLSTAQVDFFNQDGYVLVQQMFDAEEINLLHRTAKSDQELDKRSYHSSDGRRIGASLVMEPSRKQHLRDGCAL